MTFVRLLSIAFLSASLISCAGPPDAADSGSQDTGSMSDALATDQGGGDQSSGRDTADGGGGGGDFPLPGFGVLSGDCDLLDTELDDMSPYYFRAAIDFAMDPYDDADFDLLTPGGQKIVTDGNLGGSSLLSEVFAFEVLARCEGADLLKTEAEIAYQNPMGKKTDLIVSMDGVSVGVSVTRAVAFPFEDPYSIEQAGTLLQDKLQGVIDSSANVAPDDVWEKQVLAVLAYSPQHAESLLTAYQNLDEATKADTIVWVTVTDGDDSFIY